MNCANLLNVKKSFQRQKGNFVPLNPATPPDPVVLRLYPASSHRISGAVDLTSATSRGAGDFLLRLVTHHPRRRPPPLKINPVVSPSLTKFQLVSIHSGAIRTNRGGTSGWLPEVS